MLQRTLNYPELADPMVRPRYTGLATFMRLPYAQDLTGLDIGLIGVPFDGGVTNRPGARHGPREIRNQSSLMRRINQASGIEPYALFVVCGLFPWIWLASSALEGSMSLVSNSGLIV